MVCVEVPKKKTKHKMVQLCLLARTQFVQGQFQPCGFDCAA